MTKEPAGQRPPIHMIEAEADALWEIAAAARAQHPATAALLMQEIERADMHQPETIPPGVVTMGSTVVFADDARETEHTVRLVWPREADYAAGRVSVMTPVGAGLIGMREGSGIDWPDRDGHPRRLRILSVRQPQAA